MAVRIEIDPLSRRAAFLESEGVSIETAGLGKVRDWYGKVKSGDFHGAYSSG